ncbi:MAG: VacJ family lipoprotein [Rhodobacteraceae bacterium]|nr:VacJ family lipoprotein [Paracoccaceae bacterium]
MSFIARYGSARVVAILALVLVLDACSPAPPATGINDPFEANNRRVHNVNKAIDQNLLKPISGAYGSVADGPIINGIGNFTSNLSLPGIVLNDLLQGNLRDAFSNTARFTLNSTFGLAGILDVATQNGLGERPSDFGETLHVWGAGEGVYVELPLIGASTERDTAGMVVDFFINPVNAFIPAPDRYYLLVAKALNKVGSRARYADLVDQVLYQSADSYAQNRLVYLQSRRRDLEGQFNLEDLEDPYAK